MLGDRVVATGQVQDAASAGGIVSVIWWSMRYMRCLVGCAAQRLLGTMSNSLHKSYRGVEMVQVRQACKGADAI